MTEPNARLDLPEGSETTFAVSVPPVVEEVDDGIHDAFLETVTPTATTATVPMAEPDRDPTVENSSGETVLLGKTQEQVVAPDSDAQESAGSPPPPPDEPSFPNGGNVGGDDDASFAMRIRRTVSDGDEPPIPPAHHDESVLLVEVDAERNEEPKKSATPDDIDDDAAVADDASADDGETVGAALRESPPENPAVLGGTGDDEDLGQEVPVADSSSPPARDDDDVDDVVPSGDDGSYVVNLVDAADRDATTGKAVDATEVAATVALVDDEHHGMEEESINAKPDPSEEEDVAIVSADENPPADEEEMMELNDSDERVVLSATATTLEFETAPDATVVAGATLSEEEQVNGAPGREEGAADGCDDDDDDDDVGPSPVEGTGLEAPSDTSIENPDADDATAAESTNNAPAPDLEVRTAKSSEPADLDPAEAVNLDRLSDPVEPAGPVDPADAADIANSDEPSDPEASEPVSDNDIEKEADHSNPLSPTASAGTAAAVPMEGEMDHATNEDGTAALAREGPDATAVDGPSENVSASAGSWREDADGEEEELAVLDEKATRKRPYEEEPAESSVSNSTKYPTLESEPSATANPDIPLEAFKAKKSKKEKKQKKEKKRKKEKKKKKDKKTKSKGSSISISSDDYDDTSCYDSTSCDDSEAQDSDLPIIPREVRSSIQGSTVLLPPPAFDDSAEFDDTYDEPLLKTVTTIETPARIDRKASEPVIQDVNESRTVEVPVETSSAHMSDEGCEGPPQRDELSDVAPNIASSESDRARESLIVEGIADAPVEESSPIADAPIEESSPILVSTNVQDPAPLEPNAVQGLVDPMEHGSRGDVAPTFDAAADIEPDDVDTQQTEAVVDDFVSGSSCTDAASIMPPEPEQEDSPVGTGVENQGSRDQGVATKVQAAESKPCAAILDATSVACVADLVSETAVAQEDESKSAPFLDSNCETTTDPEDKGSDDNDEGSSTSQLNTADQDSANGQVGNMPNPGASNQDDPPIPVQVESDCLAEKATPGELAVVELSPVVCIGPESNYSTSSTQASEDVPPLAPNLEGAPKTPVDTVAPVSEDIDPLLSDETHCAPKEPLSHDDDVTPCENSEVVEQSSMEQVELTTDSLGAILSFGETKQDDVSGHDFPLSPMDQARTESSVPDELVPNVVAFGDSRTRPAEHQELAAETDVKSAVAPHDESTFRQLADVTTLNMLEHESGSTDAPLSDPVGESRQPIEQSALTVNETHSAFESTGAQELNAEQAEKADGDIREQSSSNQLESDGGATGGANDLGSTSSQPEESLAMNRIFKKSTTKNAVPLNSERDGEGSAVIAQSSTRQPASANGMVESHASTVEQSANGENVRMVGNSVELLASNATAVDEPHDDHANQQDQGSANVQQGFTEKLVSVDESSEPASKVSLPNDDKDMGKDPCSSTSEISKGIKYDDGAERNLNIPDQERLETVDLQQSDATSPQKRTMLVLVSSQALKREVVANQQMAFTVLSALKISYETLDGALPVNQSKRNQLFALSGLRGQYPQFFKITQTEAKEPVTMFYGDWDQFHYANECGTLRRDFGSSDTAPESFDVDNSSTAQQTHGQAKHTDSEEGSRLESAAASSDFVATAELSEERTVQNPQVQSSSFSNAATANFSDTQRKIDLHPVNSKQGDVEEEPIRAGRRSPIPPKRAVTVPAAFGGKVALESTEEKPQRSGRASPIPPKRAVVVPSAFSGRTNQTNTDEQQRPMGTSSPNLKSKAVFVPPIFGGLEAGETVEMYEEKPRVGRTSPIPPKKAVVVPAAFGGPAVNNTEKTNESSMPRPGRSSPIPPKKAVVVPSAFGGPKDTAMPSDNGPQRLGRSSPIVPKKAVVVPAAFMSPAGQAPVPRRSPVTMKKPAVMQALNSQPSITSRVEDAEGGIPRLSPSSVSRKVLVPAAFAGGARAPGGSPTDSPVTERIAMVSLPFGGQPKQSLSVASVEPENSSSFPQASGPVALSRDVPITTQLSRTKVAIPNAFSSPDSKASLAASPPNPVSSRSALNSDSSHSRTKETDIADKHSKLGHVRTNSKSKVSIPPAFGGGIQASDNAARRFEEPVLKSSSDHVASPFLTPSKKLAIPSAFGASPAPKSNQPLQIRSMHSTPSARMPVPARMSGHGPSVPSPSSELDSERKIGGLSERNFDLASSMTKTKVQIPSAFGSQSSHEPSPRTRSGDLPVPGAVESSFAESEQALSAPMAAVELFPSRKKVAIPDAFGGASSHGLTSSSHHSSSKVSSRPAAGLSSPSHHKGNSTFRAPVVVPATTAIGSPSIITGIRNSSMSTSSSSKYVTVGDAVMTRSAAAAFAAQEDSLMNDDTGDIPMIRRNSKASSASSPTPAPKKKVAIPAAFLGGTR